MQPRSLRTFAVSQSNSLSMTDRSLTDFPGPHQLRAAASVLTQLSAREPTTLSSARLAYSHFASEGVFSPQDLVLGEQILLVAGLVLQSASGLLAATHWSDAARTASDEVCLGILASYLGAIRPVWLAAATRGGEIADELVPEAARDSLRHLLADPERREAFLLNAARVHDDQHQSAIGDVAEEYVVDNARKELRIISPNLSDGVVRVSLISDQLGYDVVAPNVLGGFRRLEVKGTGRLGHVLNVFLSRNEAEVGLRDPGWALVVCLVRELESTSLLGWLRGRDLREQLPVDRPGGRWEECRLSISPTDLRAGLPSALEQDK